MFDPKPQLSERHSPDAQFVPYKAVILHAVVFKDSSTIKCDVFADDERTTPPV
jgi:hypothetical protein